MKVDPYILLGIDESVSDNDVTNAYHCALRRFPPEDAPDAFADISEAYESVKTEELRIKRKLLPQPISCEQIASYFDELKGAGKSMPPVKRDAWMSDSSRLWLRSRVK